MLAAIGDRRRALLLLGTFALSALAGIGIAAAVSSDGERSDAPEPVEPVAAPAFEVLAPVALEDPPHLELLDELLLADGDDGGDDSTWPLVAGSTTAPADVTDTVPPAVLAAFCPDSDDDPACAADAAALLAMIGAPADDGTDDGDDSQRAGARDGLLDLLCGPTDDAPASAADASDSGADEVDCRGAATTAADTAGDPAPRGADDDGPVLIDLCAGPEPLEGCEDGIGGTVSLALTVPVEVHHVHLRSSLNPLCRSLGPMGPDQVSILAVTNVPARIEGTATPRGPGGVTGEPIPFAGEATDEARAWTDDGQASTITCALLDRPAAELTELALEGTATGDGDGAPEPWSAVLGLPDPGPGTPGPRPAQLLPHDPDRPPIEVTARGREITVQVFTAPDEVLGSLIGMVPRDPADPETDRCQALEDGEIGPAGYMPLPYLRSSAVAGTRFSVRHTYVTTLVDARYQPGPWDVCVVIRDDLSPPNPVERHAVMLIAPEEREYDVVASYHGSEGRDLPTAMELTVGTSTSRCVTTLEGAALGPVERGAEATICTLRRHPSDVHWSIVRHPTYAGGDGRERISLVPAPDPTCFPDRWLPSCSVYYALDVHGPDVAGQPSRTRHGVLTVGLRPKPVSGRTTWAVGAAAPYGESHEAGFPRLDIGSLSVGPHAEDPSGALEVRFRTDRPAEARVVATYWRDLYAGDPADPCPGGGYLQQRVTTDGAEGVAVLPGACIGSRYRVSISLRDPGEDRWAIRYTSNPTPGPEVIAPLDALASSGRTERVQIRIKLDLQLEMLRLNPPGETNPGLHPMTQPFHVIPNRVHAHAGGLRAEMSQHYSGNARLELYCDRLETLDQAGGPEVVDTGWQVIAGLGADLRVWDSVGRTCPNAGQQLRRDRSSSQTSWRLSQSAGWDVRDLLEQGEVRIVGEAMEVLGAGQHPDNARQLLRATLVVTAEPA